MARLPAIMFLRSTRRFKDGKEHRYWSIVESKRCAGGKVVQRQVLYLGEINDSQHEAWCRAIEAFDEEAERAHAAGIVSRRSRVARTRARRHGVQVRLDAMELHRPRQWGACWLACQLYEQLGLDRFWAAAPAALARRHALAAHPADAGVLSADRSGQRMAAAPAVVRAERHGGSARGGLRAGGEECALPLPGQAAARTRRRCSRHLRERWQDLFGAQFEVLLYDLTSTYFESRPPRTKTDKRRLGYSRDKRSDCVQVVIALIVTPEGFPLAYEVLPGNTADNTTLRGFLHRSKPNTARRSASG